MAPRQANAQMRDKPYDRANPIDIKNMKQMIDRKQKIIHSKMEELYASCGIASVFLFATDVVFQHGRFHAVTAPSGPNRPAIPQGTMDDTFRSLETSLKGHSANGGFDMESLIEISVDQAFDILVRYTSNVPQVAPFEDLTMFAASLSRKLSNPEISLLAQSMSDANIGLSLVGSISDFSKDTYVMFNTLLLAGVELDLLTCPDDLKQKVFVIQRQISSSFKNIGHKSFHLIKNGKEDPYAEYLCFQSV